MNIDDFDSDLSLRETFVTVAQSYRTLREKGMLGKYIQIFEQRANVEGRAISAQERAQAMRNMVSRVSADAARVLSDRRDRRLNVFERMLVNDATAILPEAVGTFHGGPEPDDYAN